MSPTEKVAEQTPEQIEAFELYTKLVSAFMDLWKKEREDWMLKGGTDHLKFQRQSVLALANVSAVLGVDSLMTEAQFRGVCNAMWHQAQTSAQKFG